MVQTSELAERHGAQLELISVDREQTDYEQVAERIPAQIRQRARLSWDAREAQATRWEIATVPTVLVVDGDGKVQYRHVGHLLAADALALESVLTELTRP